jgi:aspartyl-tRNA synthetase
MPQEEQESLKQTLGAGAGDLVLLAAGPRRRVDVGLNAVRLEIGTRLGLRDPDVLHFAWITDFPMYERDEETGAIIFSHNPFSMPQGGLEALTTMDPLDVLGYQYDIVCNGVEISSGAIRNNDPATLYKAFEIAGYDRDTVREQFGHMIEAFELGCPPHGGIAPGFERLLMLFTGATPLREVVPFPKNQSCQDLMVGAPSEVDEVTLRELGLVVRPGVASGAAS